MLTLERISKVYGSKGRRVSAIDDVSLALPRGEFCVLLGPSGAGKSTVLRVVNGMTRPTKGRVYFDGRPVTRRSRRSVQRRIGTIHQQFFLVPRLSVLDNVLSGALPRVGLVRALLKLFPGVCRRRACDLLRGVELEPSQLYQKAGKLSGGQQQRVAIARAFILDPELVLADEPVASLDPSTSRAILRLLHAASRESGATVLCSLHQVELAREFADRVVAMRRGRLVFDGKPGELDAETLGRIYDGQPAGPVLDKPGAGTPGSSPPRAPGPRVEAAQA